MMISSLPLAKEVVLVGGGHAHALLLRSWGMKPVAGARLTLINPAPTAPYTGMLPGHVAGHYRRDALEIDLVKLARHAGARIIFGQVHALDAENKRISVPGRPDIPFDMASLDIGITSEMPSIPGFSDHAVSAKPLGPFAEAWRSYLDAEIGAPIVVIGGGIGGVELALAMRHRTVQAERPAEVTVVDAGAALRGVHGSTRLKLVGEMRAAGIKLLENTTVETVFGGHVALNDGRSIEASLVIGAAGARPFDWLRATGLHLTDGFVTVDANLRSVNHPNIYAAGDCAHLSHAPRPKAGVFAVRAAPVLSHNLRADLTGNARRQFRPQSSYLKLISLGGKRAVTDKWGVAMSGDWVWSWKDRIDRAFMDRLVDLPDMTPPPLRAPIAKGVSEVLGTKPLCGGCGAKVGSMTLNEVLVSLPRSKREDIRSEPGDDAALLAFSDEMQILSTDHLRAFWEDPFLMAQIAVNHALGDVWAMGSTPQALLAQIILPRMAENLQSAWLAEIMAGANSIASAEGAEIVGGHTTLGAELTIGFTVTGVTKHQPTRLSGGVPGDTLVLTRPIGSGTLLAAEMIKRAKGDDVAAALAIMATPQGDAASHLSKLAHAMTDVTGFGLAGHVARLATASNCSAELDIDAVPLFNGALALAENGIRSSLFEANRAAVLAEVPDTPLGALLFDPQTAGGLLAAVPEEHVTNVLGAIEALGHRTAVIGHLTPLAPIALKAR